MTLAPSSGSLLHPTLGPVSYSIREVSDNPDEQVADTIGLMRDYASADRSDPALVEDVAYANQSGDPIQDTFEYLRRNGRRGMQFVRDEVTGAPIEQMQGGAWQPGGWRPVIETLIRPSLQCRMPNPQGDCDDFAQYGAAHLLARGIPCAFATVGVEPNDPSVFSHVYLVAYPNGQRIPMDLSHGPYAGWECPNPWGKFCEWPVRGIGLLGWTAIAGAAFLLYRCAKGARN